MHEIYNGDLLGQWSTKSINLTHLLNSMDVHKNESKLHTTSYILYEVDAVRWITSFWADKENTESINTKLHKHKIFKMINLTKANWE